MAALLDACDENVMFRRFGRERTRVLLNLQAEISYITRDLDKLDEEDDGSETAYRLRTSRHKPEWDGQQKRLYRELESKLSEFGKHPNLMANSRRD